MNLILAILKTVPLFQSLTEEQHESIFQHITMEYFPENYVLFKKGVIGDAMFIIKSGKVNILDGDECLATLGKGQFFGEMALLENKPRMAEAKTATECEIFLLKKSDFTQLIESSPDIKSRVKIAYDNRKSENAIH